MPATVDVRVRGASGSLSRVGTGDIVATHASGGDLTINAYSVTGLAPSALDKTSAAKGTGTSPSSGATGITSHANEFLWGTIGYSGNDRATGTWIDGFLWGAIGYATNHQATGTWSGGFISGTQFTDTGGISGVEDGYKTVSSTGAYTAAKAGVDKDAWAAVIATYATVTGP